MANRREQALLDALDLKNYEDVEGLHDHSVFCPFCEEENRTLRGRPQEAEEDLVADPTTRNRNRLPVGYMPKRDNGVHS